MKMKKMFQLSLIACSCLTMQVANADSIGDVVSAVTSTSNNLSTGVSSRAEVSTGCAGKNTSTATESRSIANAGLAVINVSVTGGTNFDMAAALSNEAISHDGGTASTSIFGYAVPLKK